jgi:UDP-N-acetyl-D-mannosaminuronic acid dehydrogenase
MVRISVLGMGYMGLPTALFLARAGNQITGVDVNEKRINDLKQSSLPFNEPGLNELFEKARNNITFSTKLSESDAFIIAVPTPVNDFKPDYSFVEAATKSIALVAKPENLVVLESTVGPRACEEVVLPLLPKGVRFAYCSERAIPGSTLKEMVGNDRIIGALDDESFEAAKSIYSGFVKGEILQASLLEAELAKLVENASRDNQIAFANELARCCDELGANAWRVIELANRHPRVNILSPGIGVGGHCIPVDPWYLIQGVKDAQVMRTARESNDAMPYHAISLVKKLVKGIESPVIAVLGLTYKENVDDDRSSPAREFAKACEAEGWKVRCHDPLLKESSFEEAAKGAHCLCFLVAHDEFKKIQPAKLASLVESKNVFDARNFLDASAWTTAGFKVKVLGDGK